MDRSKTLTAIRASPLWDMFSRLEEYEEQDLDAHQRFKYKPSSQFDICNPSVSRLLVDRGFSIEYPDGRDFALVLTHDVDQLYPSMGRTLLSTMHSLRRLEFHESWSQLFWLLNGKDHSPFRRFKEIMELERKYDGRSSFYFLAEDKDSDQGDYPLEHAVSDIAEISDQGWEIGLHGTYDAYLSKDKMIEQKIKLEKVLGKPIIGYRNHFLRFKAPETWRAICEAGFSYDSTLGYVEQVGFRNGMCHPFQPYDRKTEEVIPIFELPLAIIDGTIYKNKMGLSSKEVWELIEHLLRSVKEYHGTLVVLWHNMTFGNPALSDSVRIYENILKLGKEENGWLCSGSDIIRWWGESGF